jgi:hypothetical protein
MLPSATTNFGGKWQLLSAVIMWPLKAVRPYFWWLCAGSQKYY